MPAQLILLQAATAKADGKPPKQKPAKRPDDVTAAPKPPAPPKKKFPEHIPLPIGTLIVMGQEPHGVGHFDNLSSLAASLRTKVGSLPGGSNTVFATVGDIADLQSTSLHDSLAKLPDHLTIVVGQGTFND